MLEVSSSIKNKNLSLSFATTSLYVNFDMNTSMSWGHYKVTLVSISK
jgi:hypothetical protein